MSRPYSLELKYVIEEALDSGEQLEEEFNSLHLLFALFMLDNSGGMLLAEEGWNEQSLIPYLNRAEREPESVTDDLMEVAEDVAGKYRSPEVNCLHLVVALCRHRKTLAFRLMERAGVPTAALRNRAVSLLVDAMPRRYTDLFEKHSRRAREIENNQPSGQPQPDAWKPAPRRQTVTHDPSGFAAPAPASPRASLGASPDPQYNVLPRVATDLMARARNGELEAIEGREQELLELVDVLNKRKANNPLVIGPPGVGKTALVEGLAWLMAHRPESAPGMEGRRIFKLEPARMLKDTHMRGSFSERIEALRTEVANAEGAAVVFLDEIHQLFQGSADGSQEIAQELKQALAAGDFPCIGATTTEEYRKTIQKDPAFSRRFHVIEIEEPGERDSLRILDKVKERYESHHGAAFTDEALKTAVRLTDRYMRERHQPDKALTVLDLAGSRARRSGQGTVDERLVAEVVSQITAVPVDQLVTDEAERYLNLEARLSKRIVGHGEVLARIAESLRRNVAGFSGERPTGTFLFVGPTGVGKTEIARALADELFGNRDSLIRFDMSEFSESHSVAKLIGAPPGYVGYQEGGALTDAIRRKPFQIVLFDEIEKAHADVHQLLLQLLDEGRLTDNLGRPADFTHAIVIMTSNLGSRVFDKERRSFGFGDGDEKADWRTDKVIEAVKAAFAPEFFNRIDEKIVFSRLTRDEVRRVARLLLEASAGRLYREKDIRLSFADDVFDALADAGGYDPRYGARPMRRAIQSRIEGPLASLILKGEFQRGQTVRIEPEAGGRFRFEIEAPALGERP